MAPVQRFEPDDPREWLNRARSNLTRAHATRGVQGIYHEDICFDAQQAAEKAIKGVLLSRGVDFPKVHDIAKLLTLAQSAGVALPDEAAAAAELTDYAVATRYSRRGEPVSEEDCDSAIGCAEAVFRWASDLVGPGGAGPAPDSVC